ncbi:MAG: hypothetical protein JWN32_2478, partial [Solirubrobacterales bacterium]|nr:hypothetical protein [Solirubrobacterales bacterium]
GPGPGPGPPPPAPGVPALSKPRLSNGKVVFTLSSPGSVTLLLQRAVAGHRTHGHCVAGKKRTHKCTAYTTVAKIVRSGLAAGGVSITLPKKVHGHKLKRGKYHVVVTPASATGKAGTSRTLALVLR